MIGRLQELIRLAGGEWRITISTREDPRKLYDEMKESLVKIEIKKASKHRSLSANNYAWVLIDQIAEVTGKKASEVYREAIKEIGGISDYYGMKEAAFETFRDRWIDGHLGRQVEIIPGSTRPGWINVRAWLGSSDFDSKQMSILIDNLIMEAENQGIPTITEQMVERMVNRWENRASCKKINPVTSAER